MNKLIILLVAILVSLSFVNIAEARPKHKRHHYHKTYTHKKVIPVKQPTYYGSENDSAASFFANDKAITQNGFANIGDAIFGRHNVTVVGYHNDLINSASKFMGQTSFQLGLPSRLWCADFMNMLVGGEDRRAVSFAHRGKPAPYGCTNCVAVTSRKGGGHVGVVSGYDVKGNPIIISGNHNRKVGVGVYAKRRVIAYRYL